MFSMSIYSDWLQSLILIIISVVVAVIIKAKIKMMLSEL